MNERAQMVTDTVRGMRRLGWFCSAIGAAVVFMSVGFLIPVFLDPADKNDLGLLNGPLAIVYLVASGLVDLALPRPAQHGIAALDRRGSRAR